MLETTTQGGMSETERERERERGGECVSEIVAKLRLLRRRRDVVGGGGADTPAIVLPQRADELGHRDGVGVVPDQSHHEHAVLAQVVVDEADGAAARVAVGAVETVFMNLMASVRVIRV